MASTGKCPYCGGVVRSDETICPHCGAANEAYVVDTPRTVFRPRSIRELEEYCAERGMPLLRMRFFIGEDYRGPRAFGVYREGDNFVVYKNKSDGSRAVRYRGPDEAYAVGELYDKLMSECSSRGIDPDRPRTGGSAPVSRSSYTPTPINTSHLPTRGSSEYRGRQAPDSKGWIRLLLFLLALIVVISLLRGCAGRGIHISGGSSSGYSSGSSGYSSSSSGYYSGSSRDDDDDWDWGWDDDDDWDDWDSDW